MTKKVVVAIAVSALTCTAWASSASAKHHAQHPASTPPAASTAAPIMGANPMMNAAPVPAVSNPATYTPAPGVNPMTNAAPIPPVAHPATYAAAPGVNPMTNSPATTTTH